jgi:hypothetical protein
MRDLYDRDILAWSEQQAELLRQIARGPKPANQPIDWELVAEEIEAVGSEQLHAVWSHLVQALVHITKIRAWPNSICAAKWRKEVEHERNQVRRRYVPSMAQKLDLAEIYRDVRREAPDTQDGIPPEVPIPSSCPFTLAELLSENELPI